MLPDRNGALAAGTYELIDKITERLSRFASAAARRKNTSVKFPTNRASILRRVGGQLAVHHRLCLLGQDGPPRLLVGLCWLGADQIPMLILRVEHSPKNIALRKKIVATARRPGLGDGWHEDPTSWAALEKRVPLAGENAAVDGTVAWWIRAVDELDSAGVLAIVLGTTADDKAQEESGADEPE